MCDPSRESAANPHICGQKGPKRLPEHIQHGRTIRVKCPKKNAVGVSTPHSPKLSPRGRSLRSLLRHLVQIRHGRLLRIPAGIELKPLRLTHLPQLHLLLVRRRERRQRQFLEARERRARRQTRRQLLVVAQRLQCRRVAVSHRLRDKPHALEVKSAPCSDRCGRHIDAVVQVAQHEGEAARRAVLDHRVHQLAWAEGEEEGRTSRRGCDGPASTRRWCRRPGGSRRSGEEEAKGGKDRKRRDLGRDDRKRRLCCRRV